MTLARLRVELGHPVTAQNQVWLYEVEGVHPLNHWPRAPARAALRHEDVAIWPVVLRKLLR